MNLERLKAYASYFETISPDNLDQLSSWFAEDARFKDPFNDVRGQGAIVCVFEHMFKTVKEPRFKVHHASLEGLTGYIHWQFGFCVGKKSYVIDGLSQVMFNPQGLVQQHIDYWDPAEQLYHYIPLLGWLLKKLRQRLSAQVS